MSYKKIALTPADGSRLTANTPRCSDMVSLDGSITIKFKGRKCYLHTNKGVYSLIQAINGNVYYTTVGCWYVCFNGAELCWRKNV